MGTRDNRHDMTASIRLAREADAAEMLQIYAPVVRDTPISFELEPPSEGEFRARIRNTLVRTPWLVCEADGHIRGYAYAGSFRPREAYQWAAEVTVYVHPEAHRRGVGRALYASLFACLRLQGFRSAVAVIALPNPASVAIHEDMGFKPVGVYEGVGYKLGRWHDVGWWQLELLKTTGPGDTPSPPRSLPEVTGTADFRGAMERGNQVLRDRPE